jgi:hypothetical protein
LLLLGFEQLALDAVAFAFQVIEINKRSEAELMQ